MTEFLAVLAGILKFWDEVKMLVLALRATPEEKRAQMIATLREASRLADETEGDTSVYESTLRS